MAEEEKVRPYVSHGTAMALSIWGIVLVSVVFFFVYGLPDLASDRSSQDTLYYVILAISGVAYIIVQLILGTFIFRFRHRDDAAGSYWHDSHRLEVGWTLGTAAVLVPIVVSGLVIWGDVKASTDVPPDAIVIEAVGAQFQWDFRYPGPDGAIGGFQPELYSLENPLGIDETDPASADDFVRTNQLVLPVDRVAHLRLRSKDVQHAFFLPNFRVKQDLVPGMETSVTFTPIKTGEYEIACAELCGLGHYRMRAFLTVMSASDYDAWLAEQAAQN
ncbi:MAG TPA: cytochrome c oxidase subunit II [Vicinamibacteria bacterium]|nr:cytochrome c oxidase subunit II [Vicinamibacteria bacterium]